MDRLRLAAGLVSVLVLAEAAVLAVSLWPQPDRGDYKVGYGYNAPSQPVFDYLRAQGFELVSVDARTDHTAIERGTVDAELTAEEGLGADEKPIEWIDVDYDPQLSRSVYAAHRIEDVVNGYSGVTKAHALLSPIADEPFSFHLFFAVVLPSLIIVATIAGALAGGPRRPFRYAMAAVVAVQLLLFFVLPATDFPGPEGTSSRIGWLSPFGIAAEVLVALLLALAIRPALGARWPALTVAAAAMVLAFLLSASFWDSTASAWAVSEVPQLVTGGGLLACGAIGVLLVRRQRPLPVAGG